MISSKFQRGAEVIQLEETVMKHDIEILTSRKMRGMIDPYTLGFLISIIGGSIAFSVHSDEPQNEETANPTHILNQVDSSTHAKDDSEHPD